MTQLKVEGIYLELLKRFWVEDRPPSPNPSARTYAPNLFAKHPDGKGISKKEFERAENILYGVGKIQIVTIRRDGKPSQRLQVKEG